jgi:hypothetical protein
MKKKIMIFLEGTIFYTKPILFLFSKKGYIPIGKAVDIINSLYQKGNEIYLCTYVKKNKIKFIESILKYYNIKYTKLVYRDKEENYSDLVEIIRPDVLIEDDCKSIGGEKEMCITNVKEEIKKNIKSIVVEEFKGIDEFENKI